MATRSPIRVWEGSVLVDWIDYNGHMNEGYYGLVFGDASDQYLIRMGFGEQYRTETGGSFYTVETHIMFLDELDLHTRLAVDTTVAGADPKRVHLLHELRRVDDDGLAATQETLMLHVDTNIDRVAPMSDELFAVAQTDAADHKGLLDADSIGRSVRPVVTLFMGMTAGIMGLTTG